MPKVTYIEYNGTEHPVEVPVGLSVMRGAVNNNVPGIDAPFTADQDERFTRYSGSQENASPERSSGMKEGLSAGSASSAIASGVQPLALCRLRTGRGELNR